MKVKSIVASAVIIIMSFIYTGYAEEVKNNNVINVVDYGANGNDGEDDLKNIQRVLDKGGTDKKLTVEIPSGKYYINGTLKIKSNTHLKLDKDAKIVKTSKSGPMIKNYNLGKNFGGYKADKNITIEGGIWDGNKGLKKDKAFSNILFGHAQDITIDRVTVLDNYEGHLIEFGGVKDGIIKNCKLNGYEGKGAREAIQLDIIINEETSPGMTPYDQTICENIDIINNEIENFSRGIGTHTSYEAKFNTDILIQKNTFKNITNEAVDAYNFKDLRIINNKFDDIGVGIEFKTQSSNLENDYFPLKRVDNNYGLIIKENEIKNIKQPKNDLVEGGFKIYGSGIRVLGSGGDKRNLPVEGTEIINNTIENSTDDAIFIKYANNSKIQGNTIISDKDGIQLEHSSDNSIINNKIESTKERGIAINNNSNNNLLENNIINKNYKHGIQIYKSSNARLIGNKINYSLENGISISETSTCKEVKNNEIINSDKHGISLYKNSSAIIEDNIIRKSKNYGISVTNNSDSEIKNNKVTNSLKEEFNISLDSQSNIKDIKLKDYKINTITETTKKITGNIVKNGSIEIYIGKNKYNTITDENGNFESEEIPYQKVGSNIKFVISDEYKNSIEREEKVDIIVQINTSPVIKAEDRIIKLNSKFDPISGVKAEDKEDGDITSKIEVIGSVDTSKPGKYTLTYKVKDSDENEVSKTITVEVCKGFSNFTINKVNKDTKSITGKGLKDASVKAYVGGKQIGKTAKVDSKGNYKISIPAQKSGIKIIVKMSKSEYITEEKTIEVKTNTKPVIKAENKEITVGTKFNIKSGVTATDKEDKDLTSKIKISGKVNPSKAGTYKIKYTVTDSDKNTVSKTVTVKVLNKFKNFTVNNVTYKSKIITGNGNSGATVNAYVKDKKIGTAKTNKNKYKINIKQQKKGTKIKVKITKSGYKTIEKTITVK